VSRIYLHFLDLYHYRRAQLGGHTSEVRLATEARRAFRLAALAADHLYMPASSYFEGELARLVLANHSELVELGGVYVSASQESLEEHREEKLPQYPRGLPGGIPGAYTTMPEIPPPPYQQKVGSSREAITARWMSVLENGALERVLCERASDAPLAWIESAWERVPDMLEETAFVSEHVHELLARRRVEVAPSTISRIIEPAYIDGYAQALNAKIVGELVFLASPYAMNAKVALSYRQTVTDFQALSLMALLDYANIGELLRFRRSPQWQDLWNVLQGGEPLSAFHYELARQAAEVAAGDHKIPNMGYTDCTMGIITALPEEFAAMRAMLDSAVSRRAAADPNTYVVGTIPTFRDGQPHGAHRVALTELKRAGIESAATAATNLLRSFPGVRLVLMVGIACGVPCPSEPSKHVRLGDVVVSDRQGVVGFTTGVAGERGLEHRDALPPPSAVMIGAMNALDADELSFSARPWEAHLERLTTNAVFARPSARKDVLYGPDLKKVRHPSDPNRRSGNPKVFRGLIGSSNILVRDGSFRDQIASAHGLRAIEMEATGIVNVAWDHSQSYGIIRGVCDYGDQNKNDDWHYYAAAAAAAYARSLIERIDPEELAGLGRSRG
jgi:nucleoside phosphorylase